MWPICAMHDASHDYGQKHANTMCGPLRSGGIQTLLSVFCRKLRTSIRICRMAVVRHPSPPPRRDVRPRHCSSRLSRSSPSARQFSVEGIWVGSVQTRVTLLVVPIPAFNHILTAQVHNIDSTLASVSTGQITRAYRALLSPLGRLVLCPLPPRHSRP